MLPAPMLADSVILPATSVGSYFFNRIGRFLPVVAGAYRPTADIALMCRTEGPLNRPSSAGSGEFLNQLGVFAQEANQDGGLVVRGGATLLPVLQGGALACRACANTAWDILSCLRIAWISWPFELVGAPNHEARAAGIVALRTTGESPLDG